MARRISLGILIALALLSPGSGCGYRLESGTARFKDPSVRMDVSPFANRSTTPDAGAGEGEVRERVMADPKIREYTAGKEVRKTVYVPGKLFSIVVS